MPHVSVVALILILLFQKDFLQVIMSINGGLMVSCGHQISSYRNRFKIFVIFMVAEGIAS